MIAKKKSAKKNSVKNKSNRGRPRKEFKPMHKRMQEQGLVNTKLVEHKIPKFERILHMPSKDKSIFYLFIFSIVLFLCSLTISFFKKHDIQELENNLEDSAITGDTIVQESEQTLG